MIKALTKTVAVTAMAIMMAAIGTAAWATLPCLITPDLADARAIKYPGVTGLCWTGTNGYMASTQTSNPNTVAIFYSSASNLSAGNCSAATSFTFFNVPSAFTEVMGQGFTWYDNGDMIANWTAKYNNSQTCGGFYETSSGGPAYAINPGDTTRPHTDTGAVTTDWNAEAKKIRILDQIFIDDTDQDGKVEASDKHWLSYSFFHNGNHIALHDYSVNGTTPTILATGAAPDYIAEGANFFKRNAYYYMLYSRNHFLGGYGLYWRKATSMTGLASATEHLMFGPEGKTWLSQYNEYGYTRSFGHGSVKNVGSTFYMFYQVGVPISGTLMNVQNPNTRRDTYMDVITFQVNGDINTPTKP